MCTVYILYSDSLGKYYTGHTINLELRLKEHNSGKANYSQAGIPWQLVYSAIVDSRSAAMLLEKQIKKQGAKRYLERNQISH